MDPAKPDIPQELTILDLNNDCLDNIFKRLNYPDLLNVLKTHQSFGSAVETVCKTNQYEFLISMGPGEAIALEQIKEIGKFLSLFGNIIKGSTLTVKGELKSTQNETVLKHVELLIKNVCTGANIVKCHLSCFSLHKQFFYDNLIFFKSLSIFNVLNFPRNGVADYGWLLFDFPFSEAQWKDVGFILYNHVPSVSSNYTTNLIEKVAASNLEVCNIVLSGNPVVEDTSVNVPENLSLKRLHFRGISFHSIYLEKFPNLTDIAVISDCRFLSSLSTVLNLNQLRMLCLQDTRLSSEIIFLFSQLAEKNNLEYLELGIYPKRYLEFSRFKMLLFKLVNIICQMTNLKYLHFTGGNALFFSHFPKIGCSLPNLKSFFYIGSDHAGYELHYYAKILEFVEVARNLTYLYLAPYPRQLQKFYKSLVEIRRAQEYNKTLFCDFLRNTNISATAEQQKFVNGKFH